MSGSVLNPFNRRVNSIVILVFTDEETKAQSILVICQRPQNK